MKKLALLLSISLNILLVVAYLSSCKKESPKEQKEEPAKEFIGGVVSTINMGNYSRMIPVDTANKMILSYLNSINYQTDDSKIRSLIYNADSLRKYLSDTSIKNIKLMFAHTLDYINSGGQNINCGYDAGALTVVLVGYNRNGNYVTPNNTVADRSAPCPHNCESILGSAANNLIIP